MGPLFSFWGDMSAFRTYPPSYVQCVRPFERYTSVILLGYIDYKGSDNCWGECKP